jgi:hypothetical protein
MDYGKEKEKENGKSKSNWIRKWNCHDMSKELGSWIQLDDRRRTTHGNDDDEQTKKNKTYTCRHVACRLAWAWAWSFS